MTRTNSGVRISKRRTYPVEQNGMMRSRNVGRGREVTVGDGANGLDSLGAIQQEVEQAIQIGIGLWRELDSERHLQSCFTRAATLASSFDNTTSDGMETPVQAFTLWRERQM
jgi:hypothetical protein